MEIGVRQI